MISKILGLFATFMPLDEDELELDEELLEELDDELLEDELPDEELLELAELPEGSLACSVLPLPQAVKVNRLRIVIRFNDHCDRYI